MAAAKTSKRDVAAAAKRFGMKESEITDLKEVDEGTVVTTHDGQKTLWRDDDSFEFGYARD